MNTAKRYPLGAATHVADLHISRDWFLEANHDLEVGDAADPLLLDEIDEQQRRAGSISGPPQVEADKPQVLSIAIAITSTVMILATDM